MTTLTDVHREELRQQLLAMRLALRERAQAAARNTQPVSLDQPIGRLTRMDAIQQQHMAHDQQRRAERELEQVDAALRRIDLKEYGFCLRCQDEIPYERLKIRPMGTLCYTCQCELEKRAK